MARDHGWTHPQCERCWVDEHTDDEGRVPVPCRVIDGTARMCCFCGYPTWAGIYVRFDPEKVPKCSASQEEVDDG